MSDIAVDVGAVRGSFRLDVKTEFSRSGATVVLGPSGAGKTTLLRAIAGLERDARGQVRIGSQYWLDSERGIFLPPHRRAVGYVFQDGRLFSHLTVRGNLDFAERRARERDPVRPKPNPGRARHRSFSTSRRPRFLAEISRGSPSRAPC